MTKRALLVEIDEALGHWLCAVLSEVGLEVDWQKDVDTARSALAAPGANYTLCVVEGVIGGQGASLCVEASARGSQTILLIPRGGGVRAGIADRILEHPLTRTGLVETLTEIGLAGVTTEEIVQGTDVAGDGDGEVMRNEEGNDEGNEEQRRLQNAAADRIRLGLAALQEGNFEAAVMELDAASVLAPHDLRPKLYGAWSRYARVRGAVREARKLAADIARLAEAAPTADAHYYVAAAAFDRGEKDQAIKEAGRALAIEPDHALARQLVEIADS